MKARRAQGDIPEGVSPATLRKIRLGISPAQDVSPPLLTRLLANAEGNEG